MNCEDINELLAAYSLSVLSADESSAVRQHLASCRRHDEELAELQAAAERLPLAVEERDPPPALRTRLLQAFDVEVALQSGAKAAAPSGLARRFAGGRPSFALAAAAVLLLAVVGLATWNAVLQLGSDGDATVRAELVGDVGQGQVLYLEDDAIVVVTTELPETMAGRAYQVWGIFESGPVSLGFALSRGVVALSADLADATAIAISDEPEGGSAQPTTEPLVVADLS